MQGRSVDEYRAPLFVAWQLTNRCQGRCIACCEESGPDRAWRDELTRAEALDLARRIVEAGVPYVAFGGGEPLGVPFCFEIFETFAAGGVAQKLETDGTRVDDAAADRLAKLGFDCIQVSVDGATAATHAAVRPGEASRLQSVPSEGSPRADSPRSSSSFPRGTTCTRSCPPSNWPQNSVAARSSPGR